MSSIVVPSVRIAVGVRVRIRELCHHCKERISCRPRQLCFRCYSKPSIRKLYTTDALEVIEARRRDKREHKAREIRHSLIKQGFIEPDYITHHTYHKPMPNPLDSVEPTTYSPGSEGKLQAMEGRADKGLPLFHPFDATITI